ncbi:MAG: aldo/keto reductase [Gammaproteobacteria bacterium]|nr:aldo/keto reductase [Gammaproteobacteria bacterium]
MRKLGPFEVCEIGLGCMNLSHAYGKPPSPEKARDVLARALDLGVDHFDSAALYGFGRNEELVGPFLKPHRQRITLVSKCGMRGADGKRTIDASPAMLRRDLEHSLKRLDTDVIDLYYLHRYDKVTPIEDSVGEMSRFVEEGKVLAIGLSEVSANTIRKAHAVHPLAAVQSEYSLWSRNVEIAVLDTCRELGISFVAFSPLGRGFLTSTDIDPDAFAEKDIRRGMPRFQSPHIENNQRWLQQFRALADQAGCTPAQLALAWVLKSEGDVHVIPGTTSATHLKENLGAAGRTLSSEIVENLESLIDPQSVSGPRYPAATQAEIDTEEHSV